MASGQWHRANGGLDYARPADGFHFHDDGSRASPDARAFFEFMRPHSLSSKELAKQKSEQF